MIDASREYFEVPRFPRTGNGQCGESDGDGFGFGEYSDGDGPNTLRGGTGGSAVLPEVNRWLI